MIPEGLLPQVAPASPVNDEPEITKGITATKLKDVGHKLMKSASGLFGKINKSVSSFFNGGIENSDQQLQVQLKRQSAELN